MWRSKLLLCSLSLLSPHRLSFLGSDFSYFYSQLFLISFSFFFCTHLSCQILCSFYPLSWKLVFPFRSLLISSHLPIPCCYSLVPPYSAPASFAVSFPPPPNHTSLKFTEVEGNWSEPWARTQRRPLPLITAYRHKNQIENDPWKMPLLLIGYSLNDMSVIPVHAAGSCYRNVSPITSTCSCYRDRTSCGTSYR